MRSTTTNLLLALVLAACAAVPARAQCILANPSFEIGGQGGALFGGWNQFGSVGSTTEASHGSEAARTTGPNSGTWGVSGFWQTHDAAPGESFEVAGHVRIPASAPLTGFSAAIVNVEWHDAGGMIDYQSVVVADAGSATDAYLDFSYVSDPAPEGTVAIVLLLGVLQEPGQPAPDVIYDQVTLFSTTPPTIDDVQWNDFPGGRVLDFAGRDWRVKGTGYYGPGPNLFSDAQDHVWVDAEGALHLTQKYASGQWWSTEVVLADALGYGDYVVTTRGRLDLLDPQVVLGLFLWEYGPCYDYAYTWWGAYNEVDIEYSRWGDPGHDLGQFVAQPYDWPGNLEGYDAAFAADEITSHAFRWLPDRVEFRAWRGGPDDESPQTMIHAWTYTGPHVPRPEQPRLHLNLWRLAPEVPAGDQEVVVTDFRFTYASGVAAAPPPADHGPPAGPAGRLYPAAPNPFNPATTVRYVLQRPGEVSLDVYGLDGRLVRTLYAGHRDAGEYEAVWDGRDAAGRAQASGIYLIRLKGRDFLETRRATLVK